MGGPPARPVLDWRAAATGSPAPCVDRCGGLATLRDPDTGRPRHKVCAEAAQQQQQAVAPSGWREEPTRATRRGLPPLRPAPPYDVARYRDLLTVWPPDLSAAVRQAVAPPPEQAPPQAQAAPVVACRPLADTDTPPGTYRAVQAALEAAGWQVQATYARTHLGESVALRCTHPDGRRAWATWLDGKAQGGRARPGGPHVPITEWKRLTGSAPRRRSGTPRAT